MLALLALAHFVVPPSMPLPFQTKAPTVAEIAEEIRHRPSDALAERLRSFVGAKGLSEGSCRQDGLTAFWAIEAPKTRAVTLTDGLGSFPNMNLRRIGKSDIFAISATVPAMSSMRWTLNLDGTPKGQPRNFEAYVPHPDNRPHAGVLKGTLTKQAPWTSQVFAGTTRDWWVYVPIQYRPDQPANVMVFQDGQWAQTYVPTVFDNLIAKGDMPVTVGIFLAPGTRADGGSNRGFEYDTLSDQYARFLLEEILPEVEKTVHLKHDAASRAISGISSGGICAFTVAWERPHEFSKVLSGVGSFVNLARGKTLREGGHNYAALLRVVPPKPIRVFLQDGENDLDNDFGNWWLANQEMAKSLAFKGYDYTFAKGKGFHSDTHLRSILPDALRWLWRPEGSK